jgi:uncharacterized protein YndB with AHSA1/START domain
VATERLHFWPCSVICKLGVASRDDRIEKRIELKAPLARVWRAISDHRQFGAWFKVDIEAPFVAGQPARGRITHPGYEHVVWNVVVQSIEPERLFSFTWHPYGIDPQVDYSKEIPTLVEFRLSVIPGGTLLIVTETGFERVPAVRRAEAYRMNESGWAQQMKNIQSHVARGH